MDSGEREPSVLVTRRLLLRGVAAALPVSAGCSVPGIRSTTTGSLDHYDLSVYNERDQPATLSLEIRDGTETLYSETTTIPAGDSWALPQDFDTNDTLLVLVDIEDGPTRPYKWRNPRMAGASTAAYVYEDRVEFKRGTA